MRLADFCYKSGVFNNGIYIKQGTPVDRLEKVKVLSPLSKAAFEFYGLWILCD